jgi:hypothetical protein
MATDVTFMRGGRLVPQAALHWAKRPLPEPPRTRRVSKWTRTPLDRLQGELEEWLKDVALGYTYDGE